MERVTGIGGIFFKSDDPKGLQRWYVDHLGLEPDSDGYVQFRGREHDRDAEAITVWSPFPKDTTYYEPSAAPFMVNYRVRDLDAMLTQLASHGVGCLAREDSEFGRFAWVLDPEGNKIELWQPPEK